MRLDLSRKACPACKFPLRKDLNTEKERCVNADCQLFKVEFNIPYMPGTEWERGVEEEADE